MPFDKIKPKPGNEIRGMMIRLYPTKEQEELLSSLESDQRRAWNWLVKQDEDVVEARKAGAVKNGLVGMKPVKPNYEGLTPEDSSKKKEEYHESCTKWNKAVYDATNKLPECSFRKLSEMIKHFGFKHDYQLMDRVISWYYEPDAERKIKPCAYMLQALVKNYFTKGKNQRRKKFRKHSDPMPIQVRSGICFKLGNFGSRRDNQNFYNCQISINGIKIRGRLPGKSPEGRILEGVSVTKQADGWWASIKQEVPIRKPPPAVPGSVIGIDAGLDYIFVMSNGKSIKNERGKEYVKKIADLQKNKKPVGRLQQKMSKHIKHIIYNELVKPLSDTEMIKVEKLSSRIGQLGSLKVSYMRKGIAILKERFGERVREVDCRYTSQDCSQCGFRSKESWSYEHGRIGKCPQCNFSADRDYNAARNIASKDPI